MTPPTPVLASRPTPSSSPRAPRAGMTLVEVVVVLFVLGIAAAFALPALLPSRSQEATLDDVVRAARATAIARAQSLTLTIARDGQWSLAAPWGGDAPLAAGTLAAATDAVQLAITPLGSCVIAPPVPPSLPRWDAARCAPRGPGV